MNGTEILTWSSWCVSISGCWLITLKGKIIQRNGQVMFLVSVCCLLRCSSLSLNNSTFMSWLLLDSRSGQLLWEWCIPRYVESVKAILTCKRNFGNCSYSKALAIHGPCVGMVWEDQVVLWIWCGLCKTSICGRDVGIIFTRTFDRTEPYLTLPASSLTNCSSFSTVGSNISNTRNSVSSDIQTLRSGLKKWGTAEFFQPTSKCLDVWWNTITSVWYSFSKHWKSIDNS